MHNISLCGVVMRRKISLLCVLILMLVCSVSSYSAYADNDSIYLGGIPAGFTLSTRGAHVVSICDVITKDGLKSPAKDAGIQSGDIILKIGGNEINNANRQILIFNYQFSIFNCATIVAL